MVFVVTEHYFTDDPHADHATKTMRVKIRDNTYTVTTQGGVFSSNGVDKGSAVLLDKAPFTDVTDGGVIVDVGCGWGALTIALAHEHSQAQVIGTDVNNRALALTEQNLTDLRLSNARVLPVEDALASCRSSGIDLLWSNPPIRIGKAALHKLLLQWLVLLNDDGEAFLVVQKNLGADSLTTWLNAEGFPTEKIASSKGFRILRTTK